MGVKGAVKRFNYAKGYGFITHTGGDDLFVHFSAIVSDDFRMLTEGDEVELYLQQTDLGLRAAKVLRA